MIYLFDLSRIQKPYQRFQYYRKISYLKSVHSRSTDSNVLFTAQKEENYLNDARKQPVEQSIQLGFMTIKCEKHFVNKHNKWHPINFLLCKSIFRFKPSLFGPFDEIKSHSVGHVLHGANVIYIHLLHSILSLLLKSRVKKRVFFIGNGHIFLSHRTKTVGKHSWLLDARRIL